MVLSLGALLTWHDRAQGLDLTRALLTLHDLVPILLMRHDPARVLPYAGTLTWHDPVRVFNLRGCCWRGNEVALSFAGFAGVA